ncbi:MAG TPA: XdhC/CoxI family protein [Thermoanaerobaculia bacterium]|jgi:xanthine dehydrogenase accessory factor|nr:XdhC/CoxI family protein [Thermoanaerobaculia bacterium]
MTARDPQATPGPLEVLAEAERTVREQGRAALCQVVRVEGSTPGKVGWKLLVRPDGSSWGNLGGGAFEAMVAADAAELLAASNAGSEVKRYYLTEKAVQGEPTGMVCGGLMEVLLEVLAAPPLVVVCGGGPVGQAVVRAAALAGFDSAVAEDRPRFREPALFPAATRPVEVSRDYREDFLAPFAGRELYVAIVSRCWETDSAALAAVVRQAPARLAYLGLMGSRRKIARVRREVEKQGLALDRGLTLDGAGLRAPIGLPIGGDTPGEIAIAIVAEMIQVRSAAAAAASSGAASASGARSA